jgi:hypothetical protein
MQKLTKVSHYNDWLLVKAKGFELRSIYNANSRSELWYNKPCLSGTMLNFIGHSTIPKRPSSMVAFDSATEPKDIPVFIREFMCRVVASDINVFTFFRVGMGETLSKEKFLEKYQ